jgi:hypothetical protein
MYSNAIFLITHFSVKQLHIFLSFTPWSADLEKLIIVLGGQEICRCYGTQNLIIKSPNITRCFKIVFLPVTSAKHACHLFRL